MVNYATGNNQYFNLFGTLVLIFKLLYYLLYTNTRSNAALYLQGAKKHLS